MSRQEARIIELLEEIRDAVCEEDDGADSGETEDGDSNPVCGYEGCGRTVSDPEETCWQHPDESED